MSHRKVIRYSAIAAMVAAAALVTTGCASSGAQSGTATKGSESGINVQQATKDLAAVVGGPAKIDIPAVGKPIPTGKTINFITCAVAVCTEVGAGVKAAAQTLGWTVKVIPNDSTPAGYQQAWDQIAQTPGDGVVNSDPVVPYTSITSLLDKANVPVVSSTSPNPVGGHLVAVVAGTAAIKLEGTVDADWVIQDARKPIKSVFVYDPSIASLRSALPGYQEAMKKNCPACSTAVLKVSAGQIGPVLAQQVVSYLQANPDVKYAAFGLGDLAIGVPAAIKAAGLQDQVKITTRGLDVPNYGDVQDGGIAAGFTSEAYEAGWRAVDKLAREFAGVSLGDVYPLGVIREVTKSTLPSDLTVPYSIPGYQAAFEKAWGVKS